MRRAGIAALAVVGGVLVGCWSPNTPAAAEGTCQLNSLPPEVDATVALIESGGPFPYPRNDGVVFGNYEGLLPEHRRGYYHEYTVPTPGLKHRGTRRIVTGGEPRTDPPELYYTGDHYESFCLIGGV